MELVNEPLGRTASFLTSLSKHSNISYTAMRNLSDAQKEQIFNAIGPTNTTLLEIEFDSINNNNFEKLASRQTMPLGACEWADGTHSTICDIAEEAQQHILCLYGVSHRCAARPNPQCHRP